MKGSFMHQIQLSFGINLLSRKRGPKKRLETNKWRDDPANCSNGLCRHKLLTEPTHTVYDTANNKWIQNEQSPKYQQYSCCVCSKKQIRTYCECKVGLWMCHSCHLTHCVTEQMKREVPIKFKRYIASHECEELYLLPPVVRYCNQSLERLKNHQLELVLKHATNYSLEEGWVLSLKYPYPGFQELRKNVRN